MTNQQNFQTSAWYKAMTLKERIASLHTFPGQESSQDVKTNQAQRRLRRWREQVPFSIDSLFAQRLDLDEISEDELLYLLGEPVEAIHNRFPTPPAWLAELAEAFAHSPQDQALPLPEAFQEQWIVGLLDAIAPLIIQGRKHLKQRIQALSQTYSQLPFDANTVEEVLFFNLPWRLVRMLVRTIILELNVARLQGILQGDTPEARFHSFFQHLSQRDTTIALLQEYPVLARQLNIAINHWVVFSAEFLDHLCADWHAIQTTFNPEPYPGVLIAVNGDMGDSHQGGRSVLVAQFSSGFQLVYKPRSLALDLHFQELLSWLNERGDHPPFSTLKVLNCGSYGWVEFVSIGGCNSIDEVQRFYERQGGYLALLYALQATDFHSENILAAGEHPILIDLEALFHPHIGKSEIDLNLANHQAFDTIHNSVLGVGLLPQRIWSNAESEGIDISGLGAAPGQLTAYGVPLLQGEGTDEMRVIRKRLPTQGNPNRPSLNGNEVNVLEYTEAIITGFTTIYRLLLQYRGELLGENGLLSDFAKDEVRIILRPTQTYHVLLRESFHPDLLRDALDRDRLFDQLWAGAEYCPYLTKVISSELEDLHQCDIPIFKTRPSSHHLWSSSGKLIANFINEPGIALAQRRLQGLSENDLAQQIWFIRASLTSLAVGKYGSVQESYLLRQSVSQPYSAMGENTTLTQLQTETNPTSLLTTAQRIGDRLEELALRGRQNASWIGLTLINERHWSPVVLGIDLYDGLAGVVLFLAYLGSITSKERYTSLAQEALTTLRDQVEYSKSFLKTTGGFNGWGGLIYTLANLGVLWDEPPLLSEAESLVELLPDLIEQDEDFDIMSGASGCIGSLLCLYHCAPSKRTLDVAIQCGDHLIANARPMEHGIAWISNQKYPKPLTGFSHGAAGIAWALLELAGLSGKERFRKTALKALAYERSLFLPEEGNWPDLRNFATTNDNHYTCMTAWCHGASGIGLARLRCLQHLDDAKIRSEINIALQTTLAYGFGLNHSLCHGDLGNLELLLQAREILYAPQWHDHVNRLASIILDSISKYGWLCGNPLGVESPGLMTGLAGIGYGLLRLTAPKIIPSVLVLEPYNSVLVKH